MTPFWQSKPPIYLGRARRESLHAQAPHRAGDGLVSGHRVNLLERYDYPNLQGFWKNQFGHTHGLIVVNAFYENVNRHKAEGRDLAPGEEVENLVLEFKPRPTQDMLVACLWSKWTGPGEPDLLSFAAITDEPPAEVAAAGHDRCIVPIKPENVDAWLNPANASADRLLAILEDRERPYYEHRMAA